MVFSYKATTLDGIVTEGFIDAADETTAVVKLRSSGVIPLKVIPHKKGRSKGISFRSSKNDLLAFTTQLSALLKAGLPLDRSLSLLTGISEGRGTKDMVQAILTSIREGNSFSDALSRHPKVFPRLYISMIKAGEAGGVPGVVLEKMSEFLESSKELREQVFSAMIYPAILILTGGISIIVLLTYVLPKFTVIFSEIGATLPFSTQVLLAFSNGLRGYWWIFAAIAVAGWIIFRNYIGTDAGRYTIDRLKHRMVNDIITKIETARFCRTLGTLLQSGVPMLQALDNARDVINNSVIASAIPAVSKGVREGKGLALPLENARIFPALALSMIRVGEETGQMDSMLIQVASTYEKSLRTAIKRFISLLEPAMILCMGLLIGFIVISMLMAIFSITDLPF